MFQKIDIKQIQRLDVQEQYEWINNVLHLKQRP